MALFLVIKGNTPIDYSKELSHMDTLLEESDYDEFTRRVETLLEGDLDRYNYYRIIKRVLSYSRKVSDYSLLEGVTRVATDKLSGEEGFYAYLNFALLKNGKIDEANVVATKYLVSEEFKPLVAQTTLAYNSSLEDRDPVYFEYLGTLLKNDSLLINSALLWAEQGDIEKSYTLLKKVEREDIKEAIALLAYDSGRRSEALHRLLGLPLSDSIKSYNLKLIGDLHYFDENWSRSKFYYEKVLEIDPWNSEPYINISSILMKNDQVKASLDLLLTGIEEIREKVLLDQGELETLTDAYQMESDKAKKDLTLRTINKKKSDLYKLGNDLRDLVLLYYTINYDIDRSSSVKVLEEYRRVFPNDVKVELLVVKNKNELYVPDIFEAKLWNLLNEGDNNREVAEYLVWYLLGLEDYNSVNLVLERTEHREEDHNWIFYYKSILSTLEGDYDSALDYIDRVKVNSIAQWEKLYSKGIIYMGAGNYTNAIESFNKSLIAINQSEYVNNRDIYISEIKTKVAEVLLALNDVDEAIRILNSAYELNPDNYRSDLLRSIHSNIRERS